MIIGFSTFSFHAQSLVEVPVYYRAMPKSFKFIKRSKQSSKKDLCASDVLLVKCKFVDCHGSFAICHSFGVTRQQAPEYRTGSEKSM